MWVDLATFIAVLKEVYNFVGALKERGEKQQLLQVRGALKDLHFSEETIARLASGSDNGADYVAITQRDSAEKVARALETLGNFAGQRGVSINFHLLTDQLRYEKINAREQIATGLHRRQFTGLVEKIHKLNKLIEDVDQLIPEAKLD